MDTKLLTFDEAAGRLGVHVATLRGWVREGRIPAYRLGKRYARVQWEEVLAALATGGGERLEATPRGDEGIDLSSAEKEQEA